MITNELDDKQIKKLDLIDNCQVDLIMCHNRWATVGIISDDNAHPFVMENIVGAHNGSLKDKAYLGHVRLTDSELMFRDMDYESRNSVAEGLEKVLTSLDRDSAFAVSVYDRKQGEIFFVRNELRPLAFAFLEDRSVMYWSSELDFLKFILRRHGVNAKYFTLNPNSVVRIKPADITKEMNCKDPMSVSKGGFKLKRPLPTMIEKYNQKKEEEAKKAELEAQKKEQKVEEKKSTPVIPIVGGKATGTWTPDVIVNNTATAGVTTQQVKNTIDTYFRKCSCGQTTLNLVAMSKARRGVHNRFKYIEESDQYKCSDTCQLPQLPPPTVEQERAVG